MNLRALSPSLARRAAELARNGLPPQPIQELMEDIQGDMRVARLRETITGQADPDLAVTISYKKFLLDGLYSDWIEGKTISFPNQE